MKLDAKLRKLLGNRSVKDVADAAGVSRASFSTYINRGSIPRADVAMKLASYFAVSLEWLADDEQDFPPPEDVKPTPSSFSDDELLWEITQRYRVVTTNIRRQFEMIDTLDWGSLVKTLAAIPFGGFDRGRITIILHPCSSPI